MRRPRAVRRFDIASEIFAVRHLPGDFFSFEETKDGMVLALGDIGGKGLAAGMWVTHLIGLIRTYTALSSNPETIVAGVNRDFARLSFVEPLSSLFVAQARFEDENAPLLQCRTSACFVAAHGRPTRSLSEGGPVLGAVPAASFD